jgi:hypothetical protein
MSSLSEQERIGLEEVFLSISSSQNFIKKWSLWSQNFSVDFDTKKFVSPFTLTHHSKKWLQNSLKNHKITKLFTKMEKRRKN